MDTDEIRPRSATTEKAPERSEQPSTALTRGSLQIVHSPDATAVGSVIWLDGDMLAVGRDVDEPGVRIADRRLSRVHFRVAFDGRGKQHRLGDAGSSNGTFVDGARIRSAALFSENVIRAGETVFVYRRDDSMARARDRLARVARSDLAVLLVGETGTGKERLARSVHDQSGRSGPFVAVNCAALPRDLLGAELFGHTRGAFSGAATARRGLFQAAAGGTLFLDEVGDLPRDLQPVLLRTLQENTVRPLGSDEEVQVDVRIVAATHCDLAEAVEAERFRADLYARLAQAVVFVPPLRERRSEVLSLADEFAFADSASSLRCTADAAEALARGAWPLNIRALQSLVRTFVAVENVEPLDLPYLTEHHPDVVNGFRKEDASTDARTNGPVSSVPPELRQDRPAMERLLRRHGGNVTAVADQLGKPRAQVYRWLKALGLDAERFREGE